MVNPPEPDRERPVEPGNEATESGPMVPDDPETVVMNMAERADAAEADPNTGQPERRFTAPGFDAKPTTVMPTAPEPATEIFASPLGNPTTQSRQPTKAAVPQLIPPRLGAKLRTSPNATWGWALALVVFVLALAAIAILGTVLLTRGKHAKVSQEDEVRRTIQTFDAAVQRGDLSALRTLTCGTTRDSYVDFDEHEWQETYRRVSAARQYPVIASIDQVVVNGPHAEANVTAFMAFDPQLRSTRSLDLQYRDGQWKVCEFVSG